MRFQYAWHRPTTISTWQRIGTSIADVRFALCIVGSRGTGGTNPKRLACFYFPDGVPMPLPEDPAYKEWAWFPHGGGNEFTLTNCMSHWNL